MTETLAVFRSRSQAMDCMAKMKNFNVAARLINTPKEANVGCGLSIVFPCSSASRAKNLIARANYSSFYGYMKMETRGGKIYINGF